MTALTRVFIYGLMEDQCRIQTGVQELLPLPLTTMLIALTVLDGIININGKYHHATTVKIILVKKIMTNAQDILMNVI